MKKINTIAIGCDHTVTSLKDEIVKNLIAKGYEVLDCGTYNLVRTHYPIYGRAVALKVAKKECDLGIVICGTGIGITNAANKVKDIRCVLTSDVMIAKKAREEYDANILGMGGRVSGIGKMLELVDVFIQTDYLDKNKQEITMINNKVKKLIDDKNLFDEINKKWCDGYYTNGVKQEEVPMPKV